MIDEGLNTTSEEFDGARLRLAALRQNLRVEGASLARARARYRSAEHRAAKLLVWLYTSSRSDALDVILGASTLSEMLRLSDAENAISNQAAAVTREAEQAKAELEQRVHALNVDRRAAEATVSELAKRRAQIESGLAERRLLLVSVQAEVTRLQAQERARQARLAAAAEARLRAEAAARWRRRGPRREPRRPRRRWSRRRRRRRPSKKRKQRPPRRQRRRPRRRPSRRQQRRQRQRQLSFRPRKRPWDESSNRHDHDRDHDHDHDHDHPGRHYTPGSRPRHAGPGADWPAPRRPSRRRPACTRLPRRCPLPVGRVTEWLRLLRPRRLRLRPGRHLTPAFCGCAMGLRRPGHRSYSRATSCSSTHSTTSGSTSAQQRVHRRAAHRLVRPIDT